MVVFSGTGSWPNECTGESAHPQSLEDTVTTPINRSNTDLNPGAIEEAYQNAHHQRVEARVHIHDRRLDTQSFVQTGSTHAAHPPPPPASADAHAAACCDIGYASPPQDPVKKALEDLKQDPEYQKVVSQLAFFEDIEQGFFAIDAQFGGWFGSGLRDGIIDIGNIEAAAKDPCAPGYEAARKLLQHPELLARLDRDSNGLFTKEELWTFIADLKQRKLTMEKEARAQAMPPAPPPSPSASGTPPPPDAGGRPPPETSTSSTQGTEAKEGQEPPYEFKASDLEIRPFRSTATDTGDLLADAMGHVQSEIERLTELKAKALAAGKPEDAAKIDAKIAKMNMCFQMVMSAMQQHQTMMSNIAKMWNDMAMTAIRNTH
jgi:hypothetical protein